MAKPATGQYLTHSQVEERIRALSPADCVRLERIASIFSAGTDWTAADLMHEAIVAALQRRKWRSDLNATVFLVGVMKSLAYSKRKSQKLSPVDFVDADQDIDLNSRSADREQDPAQLLEQEDQAASLLHDLREYFADDPEVLRIIQGRTAGESAAELKAALRLNQSQYETVCRRLLRGYQKRIKVVQS